ncbi:MAG: MATE family efflux transporter [Solobacterium sp.]|nr:MATE family efflux transporter [Solobacterium sp.]
MADKGLIRDLTKGKIAPVLLTLAYPVMLSNLLQTVYSMADMVIVGQFEGSAGLSAVSIGGDLIHLFTFIGMGFATAGQIMVSQYIGAGKRDELNGVIGTLFSISFLAAVLLSVLCLTSADTFLNMLHAPEASYAGALAYTLCSSWGMVFIFGYNMVSAILRGMGDSKHPMYFIVFASVMNILLDLLFIGSFHMGAFGAALATIMSQGTSLLLCLTYLYRHREAFAFDFRPASFRIRRKPLMTMLKLGLPIAVQTSAGSISGLFVSSFINTYGVAASAVTGVGNKMNSIALIVANALNTSGSSIIGQSFGAGKIDRVRSVFYHVFCFDLIFVSLISLGILTFPEQVFSLFNNDPEVLRLSHVYAPVAAISFMGFAVRSPSLAFINGLGQAKMNFFMGITEGFILRIGLTYLLGVVLGFGLQGFWYGSVIASYGYGLVIFPYFFSNAWLNRKSVAE